MVLKRHQQIWTNGEAAKVHGHLIKWLSEIIKKNRKKSATYVLAPRRGCLGYSKV